MSTLLIVLALLLGGPGLPIEIQRVDAGEIFYGFGRARYYGGCTPHIGPAYAQRVDVLDWHIFTTVTTPGCIVAVKAG